MGYKLLFAETVVRTYWTMIYGNPDYNAIVEKWKPKNVEIRECRTPSGYDSPVIPQCEPAELESHPTHNWAPGNRGPRDSD